MCKLKNGSAHCCSLEADILNVSMQININMLLDCRSNAVTLLVYSICRLVSFQTSSTSAATVLIISLNFQHSQRDLLQPKPWQHSSYLYKNHFDFSRLVVSTTHIIIFKIGPIKLIFQVELLTLESWGSGCECQSLSQCDLT